MMLNIGDGVKSAIIMLLAGMIIGGFTIKAVGLTNKNEIQHVKELVSEYKKETDEERKEIKKTIDRNLELSNKNHEAVLKAIQELDKKLTTLEVSLNFLLPKGFNKEPLFTSEKGK